MRKENNYYSNLQGSKFLKKNQQKDIEVFFSLQKHYIVISIVALYQVLQQLESMYLFLSLSE